MIAIDAPLGWPKDLGNALVKHSAGQGIDIPASDLFRRATDKIIQEKLDKKPLEVGANRIARTAHAALTIIEELEKIKELKISLAWNNNHENTLCVI